MVPKNIAITPERCKDAGLALVLICLICYQAWKLPFLTMLAIVLLLVAMTYPPVFKPFARVWFAMSTGLGTVLSKVILTVLFFVMVLPIGALRRAMGKDAMKVKTWQSGQDSVFRSRDHRFTASDMEHPY